MTNKQLTELDILKQELLKQKAIKNNLLDQQIKLIRSIDSVNLEIQTTNQLIKRIIENEN